MKRWIARLSWILLVVFLIHWLVCAMFAKASFRAVGDSTRFHSISCVIGSNEYAWVLDRYLVALWIASDPQQAAVPLIGRNQTFVALSRRVHWDGNAHYRRLLPGSLSMTRFDGTSDAGTPVTVRLILVPHWHVAIALSVIPVIMVLPRLKRGFVRWKAHRRIRALRRRRALKTLCICGYDLRHTHGRCPECGRAVRWIPVALEAVS